MENIIIDIAKNGAPVCTEIIPLNLGFYIEWDINKYRITLETAGWEKIDIAIWCDHRMIDSWVYTKPFDFRSFVAYIKVVSEIYKEFQC